LMARRCASVVSFIPQYVTRLAAGNESPPVLN